jgi:tripartite-type tricarboxylate transporter receptor subunit TctC
MSAIRWFLAIALASVIGPASAQDWPARPMTMVVAFPSGGSDDILGRIIAARMAELLGQPVNVENVAGGAGTTGTSRIARAAPDGYEFMLGTSATHALSQVLRKSPPYDAAADFTPVALIAEQPFVLIVRKDFPAEDLPAFVARSRSQALRYGSAGAGSATHLVCALLDSATGSHSMHVPYNGGAPALRDLVEGKIDHFCPVVTIAIPQIETKGVKAIAMLSKDRASVLPNVPTAAEQGLRDFAASTWFGLFLPKDAHPPVVQRLHAAVTGAMETPAVQARLNEIGAAIVSPERRTSAYLQSFLASEKVKWASALKAANFPID